MNIHKYLLPASIAATMHVALLWLMPDQPYTRIMELPLNTDSGPTKPPEDSPVTTEDPVERESTPEQVKPLKGNPAPPKLPDVPARLPEGPLVIPIENRPSKFDPNITVIPENIGTGNGVADGLDFASAGFFSTGALDRVPDARVQIPPDYPYAMKQSGTSGSVVVRFDVDTAGHVVRVEAVSWTDREFVEPALRAVRKWRFEPGRRNGRAVPFRMAVPIEFGIENN
ncbi:MAG TPA: TonB family protein [Lacunisphaera sp.]|jgi:protein TonB|nr:TonB family protein [Lacunisphaera sp.]